MFDFYTEYENSKMRCESIRRAFEQEAEIRRDTHPPIYASMLANVGKIMVDVGSRLQEQYNYDEERAANQVADAGAAAS